MSDSEDPIDIADEGGDDLFGDEGDDDAMSEIEKAVSDRDVASDREDDELDTRRHDDDEEPREFREKLVAEVPLYRHRIPRSKEGGVSHGFWFSLA
jgi:RNA polymerase-associated protein LEO1